VESAWRTHVEPRWSSYVISEISHSDVQAWVSDLTGRRSATTVLRAYGVLAAILHVAVRDRRLLSNPARGVNLPRKSRREHVYLTHSQVHALAAESKYGALVLVLACTGLRWGEAIGLRVKDLDRLRRRINVAVNAVEVGRNIEIGTPKSHKKRSVPFPAFLAEHLASQCEGKDRDALVFARWYDPMTAQFISVDPLAAATSENYNYGSGDPLNRMDPTGMFTIGFCLSASAGAMFGGFGHVCIVGAVNDVDGSFTTGFTETGRAGVHTPAVSVGGSIQMSTARSVDQLAGPFAYGGLSITEFGGVGGGIFGGKSCGAPGDHVVGGEVNVDIGLAALFPTPLPAEVHGGMSNTLTQSSVPNPWIPWN
jgi:hypothetical protein